MDNNVRVIVDIGDPCPFCGYEAVVFERETESGWVEESRECSRGCAEVAQVSRAARRRRSGTRVA
jgi:hypothetical protein